MNPYMAVIIVLTVLPVIAYAVMYGVTAAWYRSIMGIGQFIDKMSLSILLMLATITTFSGPEWQGRDVIRPMLYVLLFVGQWFAFIAFIVTYRRARRAAAPSSEDRKLQ